MAKPVVGVNAQVLKWARVQAGYSVDDVATFFKKETEVIEGWESGKAAPTYVQLERLAYGLYKRPLALFFFPEPPVEEDAAQSFRTLPDFEIENLSSDTRFALRQARAMQLALSELNEGINPCKDRVFIDLRLKRNDSVSSSAERLREYLGRPLADQVRWRTSELALQQWREAVQDKGIFVFKRSFKQRDISGFCLIDREFPVVYLNNGTSYTRQIFTLLHEVAHILLQTNGITKQNDRYINSLRGPERQIEIFCNRFTAEFLVPTRDFSEQVGSDSTSDQGINHLTARYKVSREVVLRRLLDRKAIDQDYYEKKTKEWAEDYGRRSVSTGGGDYYANQATYLGNRFLSIAFSKFYQGRCTLEQLADYLNVKVQSIPGLEQYVLK